MAIQPIEDRPTQPTRPTRLSKPKATLLPKSATPWHEPEDGAFYKEVLVLLRSNSGEDARKGEAYARGFHEGLGNWEHNPTIQLDEEDPEERSRGAGRILLARIGDVEQRILQDTLRFPGLEEFHQAGRNDSARFRETVEQRIEAEQSKQTERNEPAQTWAL